ncbi:cytochrome c oxidase subunit 7C, mitochondrial [Elysia marginata]|uniref:Cytochrome c oxidase subunit 7C, mitochondrial n=1 Tax=Elysia marginata TaxID=1093978 RepID=A0AAV4HK03_9GAST|nr:cytochrome c oxidase subunit 7C, mitochondrial [Elysia marginata]
MQGAARRALSTSHKLMSQEWQQYGVAGSNLPFSIKCRYKLTAMFALFFGSGLSAPFLIARRHLILVNTKEPPVPPQQLTTIVCFEEKEQEQPEVCFIP